MSDVIDNRIVQMEFDNKDFQKNVEESLKSIEDLKKGLDFDKATKHLANLDNVFSGVAFGKMAEMAGAVTDQISKWGTVGGRAIERLKDQVAGTVGGFAKDMTFGQINSGMSKFEKQTTAVQVLTAATGKSVSEINPYIEELMKYSDDTSQSFTNMLNSVSKFTSSGVELGTAVKAVKGISNVAYSAGVGIEGANRAMYNFAQSISAGKVLKIDWKSIENANMATKEFKNELIEAAAAEGTLTKKTNKKTGEVHYFFKNQEITYKNFADTLSKGWLSSEALLGALQKYEDVNTEVGARAFQMGKETKNFSEVVDYLKDVVSSGWMETFKLTLGDYEEVKKLWSGVADELGTVFGEFSGARNDLLKEWHDLGGRWFIISGFEGMWDSIKNIFSAISEGWQEIFPPMTGQKLKAISIAFDQIGQKIRKAFSTDTEEGQERLAKIRNMASGIATVFRTVLGFIGKAVSYGSKFIGPITDAFLTVGGSVGEMITKLGSSDGASSFFKTVGDSLNGFASFITSHLPGVTKKLTEFAGIFTNKLGQKGGVLEKAGNVIGKVVDVFRQKFPTIITIFGQVKDSLAEFFQSEKVVSAFNSFKTKMSPITDWLGEFWTVIKNAFAGFFEDSEDPNALPKSLKERFESFSQVGEFISQTIDGLIENFKEKHPKITAAIQPIVDFFKGAGEELGKAFKNLFSDSLSFDQVAERAANGEDMTAPKTLKERLSGFKDIFDNIVSTITDSVSSFLEKHPILSTGIEKLKEIFTKIKEFISEIDWEFVKEKLGQAKDAVADGVGKLAGMFARDKEVDEIAEKGPSLFEKIKNFFAQVGPVFEVVKTDFLVGADALFKRALMVLDIFLKNFSLNKVQAVLKIFESIAGFKAIWQVGGMFSGIGKAGKGLGEFFGDLSETMGDVSEGIGSFSLFGNKKSKLKEFTESIKEFAISVAIIVAAIFVISKIPEGDLQRSSGILILIGGALVGFAFLMSTIGSVNTKKKKSVNVGKQFLEMAIGMVVMAKAIAMLGEMDTKDLEKGMTAAVIMMGAFGLFLFLMKDVSVSKALVSLVFMGVALGMFAETMIKLKDLNGTNMLATCGSLALVMVAMAAVIAIMGRMPLTAGAVAALNVIEFVSVLGTGLAAIGALSEYVPELKGWIEEGGAVLEEVGRAIGRIVNGLIEGIFGISSMDEFSKDINSMGDALSSYSAKVAGLDVEAVKNSAAALIALADVHTHLPGSGGILQAIIGEQDLSKFADEFPKLGDGLAQFAEKIKDVDTDKATAAANAMQVLTNVYEAVPTEGGLLNKIADFIFGVKDFDGFASNMGTLGSGISEFAKATADVDTSKVESAASAGSILIGLTKEAPTTGGLLGFLIGEKDIATLSTALGPLGEGVKAFATATQGLSEQDVKISESAAGVIATLANKVPRTGGFLQKLIGEVDFEGFSSKLGALGAGIFQFAEETKSIDGDATTKAASAGAALGALAKNVPASGGFLDKVFGTKDIGDFSSHLGELGKGITNFAKETDGLTKEQIDNTISAGTSLAALAGAIPSDGGFLSVIFGSKYEGIDTFASCLQQLGAGLKLYAGEVEGLSTHSITISTSVLQNLATMQTESGIFDNNFNLMAFGTNFATFGTKIKEFADSMKDSDLVSANAGINMVRSLAHLAQEFENGAPIDGVNNLSSVLDQLAFGSGIGGSAGIIAAEFMNTFSSKIDPNSEEGLELIRRVHGLTEEMAKAFRDEEQSYKDLGAFYVAGLANGIRENVQAAKDAAYAVSKEAVAAGASGLESHSPSKAAYRLGEFYTEGLALGIVGRIDDATKATMKVSKTVIENARNQVSVISDILSRDGSISPVITPVFDMSNVNAGVGFINRSISGRYSMGLNPGVIAARMTAVPTDTSQDRTIEAINRINSRIDILAEKMANLQVVLNDGTLVGAITPSIDDNLGYLAIVKERGI